MDKRTRMWYGIWDGAIQARAYAKKDVLWYAKQAGFTGPLTKIRAGFYGIVNEVGSARVVMAGSNPDKWVADLISAYEADSSEAVNIRTGISTQAVHPLHGGVRVRGQKAVPRHSSEKGDEDVRPNDAGVPHSGVRVDRGGPRVEGEGPH